MSSPVLAKVLGEIVFRAVALEEKLTRDKLARRPNYLDISKLSVYQIIETGGNQALLNYINTTKGMTKDKAAAEVTADLRTLCSLLLKTTRTSSWYSPGKNTRNIIIFNGSSDNERLARDFLTKLLDKAKAANIKDTTRLFLFGSLTSTKRYVDFGHTFGTGAHFVSLFASYKAQEQLYQMGVSKASIKEIAEIADEVTIDTEIELMRKISKREGLDSFHTVIGIIEPSKRNRATGTAVGNLVKRIREILLEEVDIGKFFEMKGSPSALDLVDKSMEEAFYSKEYKGKKTTNKTYKTTAKKRVRVTTRGPKHVIQTPIRAMQKSKLNLQSLIALINAKLHGTLKEDVMGKGHAPYTLNYRTGRFARSAELQDLRLSQSGKALEADITYMRHPYDVFRPGGRLHTHPYRDPERLIGMSIRKIVTEALGENLTIRTRLR